MKIDENIYAKIKDEKERIAYEKAIISIEKGFGTLDRIIIWKIVNNEIKSLKHKYNIKNSIKEKIVENKKVKKIYAAKNVTTPIIKKKNDEVKNITEKNICRTKNESKKSKKQIAKKKVISKTEKDIKTLHKEDKNIQKIETKILKNKTTKTDLNSNIKESLERSEYICLNKYGKSIKIDKEPKMYYKFDGTKLIRHKEVEKYKKWELLIPNNKELYLQCNGEKEKYKERLMADIARMLG